MQAIHGADEGCSARSEDRSFIAREDDPSWNDPVDGTSNADGGPMHAEIGAADEDAGSTDKKDEHTESEDNHAEAQGPSDGCEEPRVDSFIGEDVDTPVDIMVDPAEWLRARGFDPEGDLCTAIISMTWPGKVHCTAMCEAAFAGELEVCCFLCEHGAISTTTTQNTLEQTPMWIACFYGNLDVAKWLFEVGAAGNIRTPDHAGATPMFAACSNEHLDVAMWLIEVGAADDIRIATNFNWTPMQLACFEGRLEVAKWLYAAGAADDIHIKMSSGCTPFNAACKDGNLQMLKWLFEVGTIEDFRTKTEDGCTLMFTACAMAQLDIAKFLFTVAGVSDDIRTKKNDGKSPMMVACMKGNIEIAKWLFKVGAAEDIRTKDDYGATPMFGACMCDKLNMAKWLFEVGAAEDIHTNAFGSTPLKGTLESSRDGRDLLQMTLWLLLQGAASDDAGHVTWHKIRQDNVAELFPTLRGPLELLVKANVTFRTTILPATLHRVSGATQNSKGSRASKTPRQSCCSLGVFSGFEESLLSLVADFAGVVRGRQLRNAREALSEARWLETDMPIGGSDIPPGPWTAAP